MVAIEDAPVITLLGLLGYIDIKKRVVPHWGVLALFLYGFFLRIGKLNDHLLMGGLVFISLTIGYFIFKKAFGGGDVKILSALAFYIGGEFFSFLSILLLMMVIGFILGCIKRKNLWFSIPLVPYIFISFLLYLIFKVGECL